MNILKMIAAGTIARLQLYLEETEKKELLKAYQNLADVADRILDEEALSFLKQSGESKTGAYQHLVEMMGSSTEAKSLLDLTITVLLYPEFGAFLKKWTNYLVTVELAFFMENQDSPTYEQCRNLYEQGARFLRTEPDAEPFFHAAFFADNRIMGYLCNDGHIDERLTDAVELFLPSQELEALLIRQEQCEQLVTILNEKENLIWIRGQRGSGRRFLVKHALKMRQEKMLFADICKLFGKEKEEELIWCLKREALLWNCAVCFYGLSTIALEQQGMNLSDLQDRIIKPLQECNIALIFCTDLDVELLASLEVPVAQFLVKDFSREERILFWREQKNVYQLELEEELLGSKYKFTPYEMKQAVVQLAALQQRKGKLDQNEVAEVLSSILPPIHAKGKIEPCHPNCTLDELVLSDENKAVIQDICNQVAYRYQVYDKWNLESKYAYGKAVSVLLSGPPGTGKTMTARVISDMLKLPLYHVNLSQLVDKYIGETEKHLEEIFTNAQKNNLILFFDEADSVFSRRSEVSDARDKYANTEVSFILQRLEDYDGIVILATNYKNNIDPAFMRRMQYIVNFHMPDENERLQLWKNSIPKECPTSEIDFNYLAAQFDFSGSSIKSAVLCAAFHAAGKGESLGMQHLIDGVKNEYRKKGAPLITEDFGKYAYLL